MSRMSREFSLVLLGSGILTAGYFTASSPEDEMERKQNAQAAERTGDPNSTTYRRSGGMFLFIHSPYFGGGTTNGRPAAYSPTTRSGGFGSVGRAFSGGGS